MRILQVINSLSTGGAEKLIVDSVPIYQKEGLETDLLLLADKKTSFRRIIERQSQNKIFALTTGSIYNPFLIFKIIPFLKRYDIVHIHLFPALYWVVLAKWLSCSKVKLVYTEHSTNNRRRTHVVLKYIDRFIYNKLMFIGCISQATYTNLKKHIGREGKLQVLHNGIVLKAFSNLKGVEKYLFFSEKDTVLIQVSSFRKQKDQKTLIESLKYLPEEVKLLLVGDGIFRKEREKQVEDLNLGERVKFLGIRNDVPQLFFSSDIVILSSFYEGFGLSIVEGMASNKPVVASNVTGLRDIVKGYGLLFEQGNAKELAGQVKMLYEDKAFYKKIQKSCLYRAKNFDIQTMVEAYISAYKKVIND